MNGNTGDIPLWLFVGAFTSLLGSGIAAVVILWRAHRRRRTRIKNDRVPREGA